jgi:hypothetical protein
MSEKDDLDLFEWLCDHVSEEPVNPRAFASELCPDSRLKYKLPVLISTTCINSGVSFRDAIRIAMKNERDAQKKPLQTPPIL